MWKAPSGTGNNGKSGENGFQWVPELDRLLLLGLKHGASAKHDAINKILELVPQLTRGDCWGRIRHLRRTHSRSGSSRTAIRPVAKAASRIREASASSALDHGEDDKLIDWVGYEAVATIAQRLKRSERAVRFRLGATGVSAKASDGWSLRALQKTLRVSPATLRRYIGTGALRVKDPRISAASITACFETLRASLDPAVAGKTAAALARRGGGWVRIARGWISAAPVIASSQSSDLACRKKWSMIQPINWGHGWTTPVVSDFILQIAHRRKNGVRVMEYVKKLEAEVSRWPHVSTSGSPLWRPRIPIREGRNRACAHRRSG